MDTSPHLAAWQEIDPPPRFRRLLTGFGISGVDSRVGASWVGACTVSFLMDGVQHQDVLSSIDDALLVAGLLNSPTVGRVKSGWWRLQLWKASTARRSSGGMPDLVRKLWASC